MIISVYESVVDSLSKPPTIVRGNAHAEQAHVDLTLLVSHLEGFQNPLQGAKERPPIDLVYGNFGSVQHLERYLVGGDQTPQGGLTAYQ
jgi:hypothetical protein